jgi:Flp pilus assembly protein TadG
MRLGRWRARRGQSLILVVGFLVALMGAVAASVTAGTVYFAQTRLQNAVDAAALAGAQAEMLGQPITTSQPYLQNSNMPNAAIQVAALTSPPNSVQATGVVTVPGSFASLFGIDTFTVRARGVARYDAGSAFDYALFQGAQATLAISGDTTVSGDDNTVNVYGGAHSNGNMALAGNSCIMGPTTVGAAGSSVSGSDKCPPTFVEIPNVPMPNWTLAQVTPQNATVLTGSACTNLPTTLTGNYILYCNVDESGQLTIDGNVLVEPGYSVTLSGGLVISGSFTVDQGSITISGGVSQSVTGTGAALAALGGGNISISGNDAINGVLYAPTGSIDLSGTQTITGAVVGEYVNLSGNKDITYDAQDEQAVPVQQVSLIQ